MAMLARTNNIGLVLFLVTADVFPIISGIDISTPI
jgi:hypothetical protein